MAIKLTNPKYKTNAPVVRNLLKWSNGFGNAAWTKQGSSTVSYGQADPGGGTDAWRVTRGTGAASYLTQNVALPTGEFVAQIKAKAATTGGYYALRIQGTFPDRGDVIFRLSDGVVTGAATASGSASGVSATSTSLGGGYYLLTLTTTLPTAFTQFVHGPCDSGAAVTMWEVASATASNADIADAQIEAASSAGPYVETERSPLSSNQTIARVVSDYNALPHTDVFEAAHWIRQDILDMADRVTLSDSVVLAKIKPNTTSTSHYVRAQLNVINIDPSGLVSFRFRYATTSTARIAVEFLGYSNNRPYWVFDYLGNLTASGVVGDSSLHSYSIQQVDTQTIDGVAGTAVWEAVVRAWSSQTSQSVFGYVLFGARDASNGSVFAGDGTHGPFVGYPRIVQGYEMSAAEVPTTGTAELPFASTISGATLDGDSVAFGGNNYLGNTSDVSTWGVEQLQATPTFVENSSDGLSVWKVIANTTVAQHYIVRGVSPTAPDNQVFTMFADIKADGENFARLTISTKIPTWPALYVDLNDGTTNAIGSLVAHESLDLGSGWIRVCCAIDVSTGAGGVSAFVYPAESLLSNNYAGDGIAGILVRRIMVVPGNVSIGNEVYIPTSGSPLCGLNKIQAVVEPTVSKWENRMTVPLRLTDGSTTHKQRIKVINTRNKAVKLLHKVPHKSPIRSIV